MNFNARCAARLLPVVRAETGGQAPASEPKPSRDSRRNAWASPAGEFRREAREKSVAVEAPSQRKQPSERVRTSEQPPQEQRAWAGEKQPPRQRAVRRKLLAERASELVLEDEEEDEKLPKIRVGSWLVGESQHKLRLDRFIKVMLGGCSEKFLDRAFRAGCVMHNGRKVRANQRLSIFVKFRDAVVLEPLPAAALVPQLTDAEWEARILFEDAHVLCIDKPAGLASAPAPSERFHAVQALEAFLLRRDGAAGAAAPTLRNVHRLDKETSGSLILAKSAEAAARLGAQFKGSAVRKRYFALLAGLPQGPEEGLWSDLLEVGADGRAHILPAGAEGGKTAKARYQLLERLGALAAVQLLPTTGRMHQLRAQAAHRGSPVAGDDRYGNADRPGALPPPRLCLHCSSLSLAHPTDPERMLQLDSPLPKEIEEHMAALRLRAAQPAE